MEDARYSEIERLVDEALGDAESSDTSRLVELKGNKVHTALTTSLGFPGVGLGRIEARRTQNNIIGIAREGVVKQAYGVGLDKLKEYPELDEIRQMTTQQIFKLLKKIGDSTYQDRDRLHPLLHGVMTVANERLFQMMNEILSQEGGEIEPRINGGVKSKDFDLDFEVKGVRNGRLSLGVRGRFILSGLDRTPKAAKHGLVGFNVFNHGDLVVVSKWSYRDLDGGSQRMSRVVLSEDSFLDQGLSGLTTGPWTGTQVSTGTITVKSERDEHIIFRTIDELELVVDVDQVANGDDDPSLVGIQKYDDVAQIPTPWKTVLGKMFK